MSPWATIRRLLAALAIVGLVLAPVVQPAMAADMPVSATHHAAMSGQSDMAMPDMAMPDAMPCCPDDQKTDCAKTCPFMAACMAQLQSTVPSYGLSAPLMQSSVLVVRNDRTLRYLSQAPPPRP